MPPRSRIPRPSTSPPPREETSNGLDFCPSNTICRIHAAVFGSAENSLESLLHIVTVDDVRTMPPRALSVLQNKIVYDKDPRWLQIYIMLLLRNVDVMDTISDIPPKDIEFIHTVAKSVVLARGVAIPSPPNSGRIVEWIGTAALISLVCVVMAQVIVGSFQRRR